MTENTQPSESSENQTSEKSPPAPESSPAPAPIDLGFITDAESFMQSVNAEPDKELHVEETSRGKIRIKETGSDVEHSVFTGIYRRRVTRDGDTEVFDALSMVDKMKLFTIHYCVVDASGEPFFDTARLENMHSGKKAAHYGDFLRECYEMAIKWNPHLDPTKNPTALRRMMKYMAY